MKIFVFLCTLVIGVLSLHSCKSVQRLPKVENTYYFNGFDLFNLEGVGRLKQKGKSRYVKVGHNAEPTVPIYFYFKRKGHDILFVLQDSFEIEDKKTIYIYRTKNFFGEKIGRKRLYRWHYYDQMYDVYFNKQESILCQFIELYPISTTATMYLYKTDIHRNITKCHSNYNVEINENTSRKESYLLWIEHFQKKGELNCYPDTSSQNLLHLRD